MENTIIVVNLLFGGVLDLHHHCTHNIQVSAALWLKHDAELLPAQVDYTIAVAARSLEKSEKRCSGKENLAKAEIELRDAEELIPWRIHGTNRLFT